MGGGDIFILGHLVLVYVVLVDIFWMGIFDTEQCLVEVFLLRMLFIKQEINSRTVLHNRLYFIMVIFLHSILDIPTNAHPQTLDVGEITGVQFRPNH